METKENIKIGEYIRTIKGIKKEKEYKFCNNGFKIKKIRKLGGK